MFKFNIDFKGSEVLIRSLEKYNKKIETNTKKILNESLETIAKNAKKTIIDENHVITGMLRDSMKHKLTYAAGIFNGVAGSLDTKVFYDKYVERLYPYLFPAYEAEKRHLITKLSKILK